MTDPPHRSRTYTDSDIDAMLADLNASVIRCEQLADWRGRSGIPIGRAVATPGLTYVRLAGRDAHGGPVVLMLLEDAWERAI